MASHGLCAMLRTKTAYYRTADGERIFHPESTTACYTCILTQRPMGPDGAPCDADSCHNDRACYQEDR